MTDCSELQFSVPSAIDNERLDKAITACHHGLSRMRVQALIRDGQVHITRQNTIHKIKDPAWRVKHNDNIHIILPETQEAEIIAQNIALDILYEDKAIIVVNKPAGLVVHPAPGNLTNTLVNALIAHCGNSLSGIGGVKRPGIVHRLDKDTSGVMVIAKTDEAHHALSEQFAAHGRDGRLQRSYEALLWGQIIPMAGHIDAPIMRHAQNRKKMQAIAPHKKQAATSRHAAARNAITHYTTRQCWGTPPIVSHVQCRLETGRTHQIRVHMAYKGHPVIADPLYGRGQMSRIAKLPQDIAALIKNFGRQALHAGELVFEHPQSGTSMQFQAPLPADMQTLIDRLQADSRLRHN